MRTEEERRARRVERIEKMRRGRRRRERLLSWGILAVVVLAVSAAVGFGVGTVMFSRSGSQKIEENTQNGEPAENGETNDRLASADIEGGTAGDTEGGNQEPAGSGEGVNPEPAGNGMQEPVEGSEGGEQNAAGSGEQEPAEGSEGGNPEPAGSGMQEPAEGSESGNQDPTESSEAEDQTASEDRESGRAKIPGSGSGKYTGTEGRGDLAAAGRPVKAAGEDANGDEGQKETKHEKCTRMPEKTLPFLRAQITEIKYVNEPEPAPPRQLPDPEVVAAFAPLGNPYMIPNRIFQAQAIPETEGFDETIISKYGIFIDAGSGTVLAQKDGWERMNPASMTKILTVLVAAEHLTRADLDATVPITIDITDYCFTNDCSITGYELNEQVPVRDLFYGTVLPSGGDSALALATYVAGSHEAFVDMMNAKLAELGLSQTSHFTNCVGLYDPEHYTTAYDLAVILMEATKNEFCREVLSAHTYTTTSTPEHPEGLLISNWFLRRIEDRDTHGEVLCAKTGFVDESGSCAASLGIGYDGREYVCVTAGSSSSFNCIADQVILYQKYLPALPSEE